MNKRLDVLICGGGACISSHSHEFKKKLLAAIAAQGLADEIKVVETGCMGPCELGPVMVVYPEGSFYIKLKPKRMPSPSWPEHFLKGRPVQRLLWLAPEARKIVEEKKQIPFFEKQLKIVLANCGKIDPENIEEYIAQRGYEALGTGTHLDEAASRSSIIMTQLGLARPRRRRLPDRPEMEVRPATAPSDQKYIICNADEGDPGAFMDRAVLEGDPHSVLEGMAIAGYAIGASQGLHLRARRIPSGHRPPQRGHRARPANWACWARTSSRPVLTFDIELRMGAGAFVCGEETALMASIEGKRGQPRPKPPFPAQRGLVGQAHGDQQRRNPGQHPLRSSSTAPNGSPPSAPRRARAPRSSPSRAR